PRSDLRTVLPRKGLDVERCRSRDLQSDRRGARRIDRRAVLGGERAGRRDVRVHVARSSSMTASEVILVIEDTPAIGRALRAALEARGYRAVVATTGQQGIDAAATNDPAAVILDLGLPDMDGADVCRRVRGWSDVPIIVLTVDDSEHRKVETLDIGADDYVTKPFSTP